MCSSYCPLFVIVAFTLVSLLLVGWLVANKWGIDIGTAVKKKEKAKKAACSRDQIKPVNAIEEGIKCKMAYSLSIQDLSHMTG
jgi:hypothetical protein